MVDTYQFSLQREARASLEPNRTLGIYFQDTQGQLETGLGLNTKVTTWVNEQCTVGCSDRVPCPSSPQTFYCDYNKDNFGTCKMCLPGENEAEQTEEVRLVRLVSSFPNCRMVCAHVVVP